MAMASQKITDIKFYEVILGVLIDEPMMLLPEMRIPLHHMKKLGNNA